jgi:hypothetical protein
MLFREQFRAFLDADTKSLTDARYAAEAMAKQRLDVSLRIKQVSLQISSLRNDIAHSEDKLQECEDYRRFIEGLTPSEWRAVHRLPELYFKEPGQLLEIMETLEAQNMFLMQHCQDAEEIVTRYADRFREILGERDGTITEMKREKDATRRHLDEKNKENEQYRLVGTFHHGNEFSEAEFAELGPIIVQFHETLGFKVAGTGDLVTMLKRIEDRMEALFAGLAKKDQDLVKSMYVEKLRRRREMERAEKSAKEQREQEEKIQRALQLATMPIHRKTGRPLMPKMLPAKSQTREKLEEKAKIAAAQR